MAIVNKQDTHTSNKHGECTLHTAQTVYSAQNTVQSADDAYPWRDRQTRHRLRAIFQTPCQTRNSLSHHKSSFRPHRSEASLPYSLSTHRLNSHRVTPADHTLPYTYRATVTEGGASATIYIHHCQWQGAPHSSPPFHNCRRRVTGPQRERAERIPRESGPAGDLTPAGVI